MAARRSRNHRPASRWAVSIVGALTIHAVVIALAWPFVRPLMVRAFGPATPWRAAAEQPAGDYTPIITGSISSTPPAVDDLDYASRPWDHPIAIDAGQAKLPFSYALPLQLGGTEPIVAPPRLSIAPPRREPTIKQ